MPRPVDATLIGELFDRDAAALEFYAGQLTTLPQDCVQEAFLELARQTAAPTDPRAWLFRVVRNRSLNAARAERRRAAHEERAGLRQVARGREADRVDAFAIADLLQQLTPLQRELVVLRVWGQLSWQEIAEVTGSSRSAAHRNYEHALEHLRRHWEPSRCLTTKPTNNPATGGYLTS